jgi:uncharacterized protein (TIGR03435 family)
MLLSLSLKAQTPQFEVATVKPSVPCRSGPTIYNPTRERFAVSCITVKSLVAYAFDVRDFQVSGGPSWVGTDQYDIVAKPEGNATSERILGMTKSLLAERFDLKVHRESREQPVLALKIGKGGPKLQPSASGNGPEVRGGRGRLVMKNVTMEMFAAQLAGRVLGRPVIDQTGIKGEFDIQLEWTPDESPDGGPSMFAALQEQLGLKLETQKGAVEVLVIDRAERPSAN